MRQAVQNHPAGKSVSCFVNPENPEEAVLSRALPSHFFVSALLPVAFIGCGIVVLWKSRPGKKKK